MAAPYVLEFEKGQKQAVSEIDTAREALAEIDQAHADGWTLCRILREYTAIDMLTLIADVQRAPDPAAETARALDRRRPTLTTIRAVSGNSASSL